MPRYNKSRYHDPVPGIDYQPEEQPFVAGKDLGNLVKWKDDCGWVYGIVEAQKGGLRRIYVFNKRVYGHSRAVKSVKDILFI